MSNRIIGVMLGTVGGAALALASAASAQQGGGPPPMPAGSGGGPRVQDVAAANRAVDAEYNTLAGRGVQVTTDKSRANPRQTNALAAPATAADLIAGAAVRDKDGLQIAIIERLDDDGAVVRAGDRLAKLPVDAFGKDDGGLLISITGAEFQAAIAQTSVPVPQQEPQIVDATAEDMMPGAAIRDSEGVMIGTVDSLVDSGVIVLTDGRKVKLAVNSFGKDEQGLLIGITASEFRAMIGHSASAAGGS
jgi:hypothetical protein